LLKKHLEWTHSFATLFKTALGSLQISRKGTIKIGAQSATNGEE
jgi:hypothetical protein